MQNTTGTITYFQWVGKYTNLKNKEIIVEDNKLKGTIEKERLLGGGRELGILLKKEQNEQEEWVIFIQTIVHKNK